MGGKEIRDEARVESAGRPLLSDQPEDRGLGFRPAATARGDGLQRHVGLPHPRQHRAGRTLRLDGGPERQPEDHGRQD